MITSSLFAGTLHPQLRWLIVVPVLALAWFAPHLGDPWLGHLERFAARFATRKRAVVVSIAAAAILARLGLCWRMPIPVPDAHDEFSHLLAADTFVHGRLTNPPHPLSIFFETFHVLQHPTYTTIYQPAQAGLLALGQVLGHPWIGVLLSSAAACAAVTWMLQGWVPPKWALLGGVLFLLRLHLFCYWLESYWGGALAVIGGALVLGSLPRIVRHGRARDAVLMGAGLSLLANTRPFEGVVFCIPVFVALIGWLASQPTRFRVNGPRILLPLACIMALTIGFMGYYNWRVTDHPLLFPHALDQRQYEAVSPLIWQRARSPRSYTNPQFDRFYNYLIRDDHRTIAQLSREKVEDFGHFFFGTALWIPLLALPWSVTDRRMRLVAIQFVLCAAGLLAIVWFNPHYAAPMTATIFVLLVQSMRHLRRWKLKNRSVGIFLTRLVVLLVLARVALYSRKPPAMSEPWSFSRASLVRQLEMTPGEHLLLVRYASDHNLLHEWVYNAADIDHSKIVWAREIPGVDSTPLLEYFRDRTVWLLEPDRLPVQLKPYSSEKSAEVLNTSP